MHMARPRMRHSRHDSGAMTALAMSAVLAGGCASSAGLDVHPINAAIPTPSVDPGQAPQTALGSAPILLVQADPTNISTDQQALQIRLAERTLMSPAADTPMQDRRDAARLLLSMNNP